MGVINKRMKTPFYSIMDHLVYKNSLKVLLTLISGDEHGFKRDYYYLSGSVLRDRSVQVEDNTNRPLGVSQGLPRPLNRDENDCD